MDYLNMVMQQLATIVHNTSQSNAEWYSKDRILDTLKGMVEDYNRIIPENQRINIKDYRQKL
jgi:hypothetical protein